jgi:autophagy-related protein 2
MIDLSSSSLSTADLKQKRIHLTFYHLTYRYDVDSNWMVRLSTLFSNLTVSKERQSCSESDAAVNLAEDAESSMTRVFVSCADINLDYSSPTYFETLSRSIVRIGDFRFSSNMMKPAGMVQAYSLSVGDVNYHISNSRNSFIDENASLCRSSWVMDNPSKAQDKSTSHIYGTMPEAILREMGFVNVLSLDMMDAIVAKRVNKYDIIRNNSKEPPISTSLTLGMLSIHSCKDSFNCFANSVGELQAKLTALTDEDIAALKEKSSSGMASASVITPPSKGRKSRNMHEWHNSQYLIPEIVATKEEKEGANAFLLDGYEWTTIDHDPLKELAIPPGDEQKAGWYSSDIGTKGTFPTEIIHQHFPLHAIADPLSEGDMGAKRFAGKNADVVLKSRLLIHKLSVKIRFLDGYDWPDKCTPGQREAAMRPGKMFVIEPLPASILREKKKILSENLAVDNKKSLERKAMLMGELLGTGEIEASTFAEAPLPEDRAKIMERENHLRMNCRRPSFFFQLSLNGVTMRMDSFEHSDSHRLQSVLDVAVSNLFVAETVSIAKPIKMFGEWINDQDHPRDTRFGTLMFKMATWAPESKVTDANQVESDDCEVTIQLLPMRCLLDQRAITFIRAFVSNEETENDTKSSDERWSNGLHLLPPPRFKSFKIKPWKVKVDYLPTKIDVTALREGSIVELVNISPIHRMVITLSEVTVVDSLGMGPVFSEIVSNWVKEICATQLHKFLANARPFEPFTDVGQGLSDLVILPYEAFKQGDSIRRAMRKGVKSLAETVVFQTLTTSSGLTKYAADLMADVLIGGPPNTAGNPLPSRPMTTPKGIGDVRRHACESIAKGIQAANYKIVVVPYRELSRNNVTGAITSVIKGIPVLLVAPLTGATEAASYTLLGARNALRPDIRKEEEESMNLH